MKNFADVFGFEPGDGSVAQAIEVVIVSRVIEQFRQSLSVEKVTLDSLNKKAGETRELGELHTLLKVAREQQEKVRTAQFVLDEAIEAARAAGRYAQE